MSKVKPLLRKKILKKKTNKFTRFQWDCYPGRMKPNWRRPHGIDNRMRRKFRGNKPMPKIGYGSDNKTKYFLPNGFKKYLVNNQKDLELLMMNNRTFCGELANNLSSKKRASLVKRAQMLNIRLTNGKGKLRTKQKKKQA